MQETVNFLLRNDRLEIKVMYQNKHLHSISDEKKKISMHEILNNDKSCKFLDRLK